MENFSYPREGLWIGRGYRVYGYNSYLSLDEIAIIYLFTKKYLHSHYYISIENNNSLDTQSVGYLLLWYIIMNVPSLRVDKLHY